MPYFINPPEAQCQLRFELKVYNFVPILVPYLRNRIGWIIEFIVWIFPEDHNLHRIKERKYAA